jgi:CTP:molybdopterin cytidylyltransferase MocA
MNDKKKRLTGPELLQQQKEREAAERSAKMSAKERETQEKLQAEERDIRAAGDKLQASWHESALAAAERPEVHFVVLAQVVRGQGASVIAELQAAMSAEGFVGELADNLQVVDGPHSRIPSVAASNQATEVMLGKMKGWKPADLPRLGSNGNVQYLIARWG